MRVAMISVLAAGAWIAAAAPALADMDCAPVDDSSGRHFAHCTTYDGSEDLCWQCKQPYRSSVAGCRRISCSQVPPER